MYKFQNKRVKRDPEGPFFGGNPIVGAILTTVIVLGTCCGVSGCCGSAAARTRNRGRGSTIADWRSGTRDRVGIGLSSLMRRHINTSVQRFPFSFWGGNDRGRRQYAREAAPQLLGTVSCPYHPHSSTLTRPIAVARPPLPARLQLLALLTTPLQALLGPSMRQASTFLVIMALGVANVYLK